MIEVEVFLNESETDGQKSIFMRSFTSEALYQPGDRLVRVWKGDFQDGTEGVLEIVFAMFNRGSGSEIDFFHRSLSMGDVVRVDSLFYVCEAVGWKPIEGEVKV